MAEDSVQGGVPRQRRRGVAGGDPVVPERVLSKMTEIGKGAVKRCAVCYLVKKHELNPIDMIPGESMKIMKETPTSAFVDSSYKWLVSSVSGELGLEPGQSTSVGVAAATGTGKVWAKTFCPENEAGKLSCLTGDGGGSPFTQAELDLGGPAGIDRYRVSVVNGFNLPILLQPSDSRCNSTGCVSDLNKACPEQLRVTTGGTTIACQNQPTLFSSVFFLSQCALGDLYFPCSPTHYNIFFCPTPTRFQGNHNGNDVHLLGSLVVKVIGAVVAALITAGCSFYITIRCRRRV
ncbi:hypothetical protein Fmac_025118 [Flemingia macrophylla]|uniref:Uncharacterized protein n=1 Tax=Flemingia macrophylla TaxID=520843 RepID=A0ABD1LT19_9FABA